MRRRFLTVLSEGMGKTGIMEPALFSDSGLPPALVDDRQRFHPW